MFPWFIIVAMVSFAFGCFVGAVTVATFVLPFVSHAPKPPATSSLGVFFCLKNDSLINLVLTT